MAPIPAREWEILRLRKAGATRPEIGRQMGLTAERVRQLEEDGSKRLTTLRRGSENSPSRVYFTERFGPK